MKRKEPEYDPHGHREVAAFHSEGDASRGDQLEVPVRWEHPHEEKAEISPDAAFAGQDAADIFRRLLADCLPPNKQYGGARRWRAAYTRMVAIAYHVAPEQFQGMTQDQVAAWLALTPRAFRKQLAAVADMMASRRSARR